MSNNMGQPIVKNVILRNHSDENLVMRGFAKASEIRETKADMIADTGAMIVGLSSSIIQKLGLPKVREVNATLADGSVVQKFIYDDLRVQILDRSGIFKCVDNGEHAPLLLGQIIFEDMDLVVDCASQKVYPNPKSPKGMLSYNMF